MSSSRHPVSVRVEFSESNLFTPRKQMSFAEFERLAVRVCMTHTDGGHAKTLAHVTFDDEETYIARLDLGAGSTLNFADHISKQKSFARSERGAAFITQHNLFTLYAFIESIECDTAELPQLQNQAAAAMANTKEQQRRQRLADEEQAKTDAMNKLRNAPEYHHLTEIGAHTAAIEVLKNIRADLKKHFPDVKFSVRESSSTAARITWEDGPTEPAVYAIVGCYKAAKTDTYSDASDLNLTAWAYVFGAVDYIHVARQFSAQHRQQAMSDLNAQYGTSFTLDDLNRMDLRINGYPIQQEFNRHCYYLTRTANGWMA